MTVKDSQLLDAIFSVLFHFYFADSLHDQSGLHHKTTTSRWSRSKLLTIQTSCGQSSCWPSEGPWQRAGGSGGGGGGSELAAVAAAAAAAVTFIHKT